MSGTRGPVPFPAEPTYRMLRALAGEPIILTGSEMAELRLRYKAMRVVWYKQLRAIRRGIG